MLKAIIFLALAMHMVLAGPIMALSSPTLIGSIIACLFSLAGAIGGIAAALDLLDHFDHC